MGKVIKKSVESYAYVSSDGRETEVESLNDVYLVNALLKETREMVNQYGSDMKTNETITVLKAEVLKRMAHESE